jgi:hypothetical protein
MRRRVRHMARRRRLVLVLVLVRVRRTGLLRVRSRMRHLRLVVKVGGAPGLLAAGGVGVALGGQRLSVGSKERRAGRDTAGDGRDGDEGGRARGRDGLEDALLVHASTVLALATRGALIAAAANLALAAVLAGDGSTLPRCRLRDGGSLRVRVLDRVLVLWLAVGVAAGRRVVRDERLEGGLAEDILGMSRRRRTLLGMMLGRAVGRWRRRRLLLLLLLLLL